MEENLRFVIWCLIVLIVLLLLIYGLLRHRRFKLTNVSADYFNNLSSGPVKNFSEPTCTINLIETESSPTVSVKNTNSNSNENNILILNVFAKPNARFVSYELLQAILATGMQYGEMNIFHYYLSSDQGRIKLFSLASATKPGDFDLDRIGDFSCIGLTLFMDMSAVPHVESAFDSMLNVAEQLAEYLDGELRSASRMLWSEEILQEYRQRVMQYS